MTFASWSSTIRMVAFRISAASSMAVPDRCTGFCGVQQGDVERVHELMDADWLGKVTEETCFEPFFDIAWHRIRRQRQHRNVCGGRVLAQALEGPVTADARQVDVHQDDV